MKPIRTKTSNRTYTGEGCLPLPATVIQFSDGKIATETCFELVAANRRRNSLYSLSHGCL